MSAGNGRLLAFTVDTEPDWGMEGTRAVRQALPRLLDLLDRYEAEATFFVVSDLLKDCGEVLRRAARRHEIGSHGATHRRLDELTRDGVLRELGESRARLSGELCVPVQGFRAPFLRVPPGWFDMLAQAGYGYDSSLGRVYPWPGNVPPWRWRPSRRGSVVELPPSTWSVGLVPFSLTYLRLSAPMGLALLPAGGVFYLHPHELAEPGLARALRGPLGMVLPWNAGGAAWRVVGRVLDRWRGRVVSCRSMLERCGFLQGGAC